MPALPAQALDARLKAELMGLLNEELRLCESLLSHIREEQTCLRDYDHAGFARSSERKGTVVNALRQLDQRRQILFRQLQGADVAAAQQNFDHWLALFQRDPTLDGVIQKLRRVAASCSLENQSLGRLIQLQTRFFDFLLKQMMPERLDGLTYMSTGEKQGAGTLRKLISV